MPRIEELIAKCKDEEMSTQNLDENAVEWNVKGKNGEVKFLTDPDFVLDRLRGTPQKVGIIIWLPADVFER